MMSITPRNSGKRFSGRQKSFLSNPPSSRASMIAGAIKVFQKLFQIWIIQHPSDISSNCYIVYKLMNNLSKTNMFRLRIEEKFFK